MPQSRSSPRNGTQSVERAFAVLKAVSGAGSAGTTLAGVTRCTGLNRTTAYRLLRCLLREGAVRADAEDSRYFLGPFALELALTARGPLAFRTICAETLTRIADATGDTVFLLVRNGDDSLCIDRRTGSYPVKTLVVEIGTRRPLGIGAASLAILQALPDREVEDVLRRNAARYAAFGVGAGEIARRVQAARRVGHVSNRVQSVEGVRALGLPLRDPAGRAIGGLAVAAIAQRLSRPRQREVLASLRTGIEDAERLLREGNVEAVEV